MRFSFTKILETDMLEITEIMMEEKTYNHVHTSVDICRQMSDEIKSGKRRFFIVRDKLDYFLELSGKYVETLETVLTGKIYISEGIDSVIKR